MNEWRACVRAYDRYERAAELAKQRDLLAAWERDGHLRNMQKLKELGPVALREYVADVMAAPASEGSFSSSSARTSAAATTAAAATTTGSVGGGAMSGRSGGAVGFDPRGL